MLDACRECWWKLRHYPSNNFNPLHRRHRLSALNFQIVTPFKPCQIIEKMERETGIEPATSSLGSLHSTAELLPRGSANHLSWRTWISEHHYNTREPSADFKATIEAFTPQTICNVSDSRYGHVRRVTYRRATRANQITQMRRIYRLSGYIRMKHIDATELPPQNCKSRPLVLLR
jgi:hypothetical protein